MVLYQSEPSFSTQRNERAALSFFRWKCGCLVQINSSNLGSQASKAAYPIEWCWPEGKVSFMCPLPPLVYTCAFRCEWHQIIPLHAAWLWNAHKFKALALLLGDSAKHQSTKVIWLSSGEERDAPTIKQTPSPLIISFSVFRHRWRRNQILVSDSCQAVLLIMDSFF